MCYSGHCIYEDSRGECRKPPHEPCPVREGNINLLSSPYSNDDEPAYTNGWAGEENSENEALRPQNKQRARDQYDALAWALGRILP